MILWLSGPAGTGKTAIAGSVADACQSQGWLAASFFFSGFVPTSPDRRSHMCLMPTLAYHLVQQSAIPELRDTILESITENPSIFEKCLEQQLEFLILGPLLQVGEVGAGNDETWLKIVIIYGVDECDADLQKSFETTQERQPGNHFRSCLSLRRPRVPIPNHHRQPSRAFHQALFRRPSSTAS
ncbi:hypothetical protein FA13DRAFT_1739861 [Coprinellus micaceus]|uniref:Nephrocystin 3-like N-terminal domain-containing protein n=1 Tax=Coprinellus micaceus TaxID=71717 RepID=A0A4Y7SPU4_COPMI|nr:hypothetical protein FA13DRAFT_1739861 [Coprinellus micaceus]